MADLTWTNIQQSISRLTSRVNFPGYNDTVEPHGMHVGCVDLLNAVQLRVKPKYHIFGHIHEGKVAFDLVVYESSSPELAAAFGFELNLLKFVFLTLASLHKHRYQLMLEDSIHELRRSFLAHSHVTCYTLSAECICAEVSNRTKTHKEFFARRCAQFQVCSNGVKSLLSVFHCNLGVVVKLCKQGQCRQSGSSSWEKMRWYGN